MFHCCQGLFSFQMQAAWPGLTSHCAPLSHWPLSDLQSETTHHELMNNTMTLCQVDRGASLLVRATTMNQQHCPVCLHCSSLWKLKMQSRIHVLPSVSLWSRKSLDQKQEIKSVQRDKHEVMKELLCQYARVFGIVMMWAKETTSIISTHERGEMNRKK